ncbi:MAG: HlyC/CorC family transporter [Planctomycetaceae bacterium]|nr:HlyC/CorC family transporter [Planctomycetales bacterium]MCB9875603.1 HlyC/CorC family transporter [Planctomycetaceae bacterium]MCB9941672.1 HlyC/CorC family transporter [Planctomycetaceae bacterium]HRX79555.1 hemolysin family protein [Pirellulaceae bacterium]
MIPPWLTDTFEILIAIFLVILNGFFVAAEFALVKVRLSQIEKLVVDRRPFAKTAKWLAERLDASLSACQLGITMASLALGWVGEPAFAHLITPVLEGVGVTSEAMVHGIAFVIAFSTITALHLVIGEQAPKIFAIRRPEMMILWCAAPLKFFYYVLYPFLAVLNLTTAFLLRLVGLTGATEHETPHTEDEIRALLADAHLHGHLTRSEHRLLNAVFEFDDMICRRVMVPRGEVDFFDIDTPFAECLEQAKLTKHTRYPLCDGSLDKVLGVIHLKDLLGIASEANGIDLRKFIRPARKVPESMPISRVLRHFQATHQLLAFVVDEYGTTIGIVTLENVLEKIVGPVEDEFDAEEPNVVEESPGRYIVMGSTLVEEVERALGIELGDEDMDTVAGVLMARAQRMPVVGDKIRLTGAVAEILEVQDDRATKIQFTLESAEEASASTSGDAANQSAPSQ